MATNEILQFAETDTGTNLLTQAEYLADAQRPIGNQPGVARSKLVNKALRQASLIAAGLAEYIADNQANNITDALTPQNIADYLQAAITGALGVTPPQFDNDTSLATTAFVQRALGSASGFKSVSTTTAMDASYVGAIVQLNDTGPITATLPATASLPDGATIVVATVGTTTVRTLAPAGADTITYLGTALGSPTFKETGDLVLVKRSSEWRVIGGSLAEKYSSLWLASLAASGYQKLPSGLIVQWGGTVAGLSGTITFPIAWPNGMFAAAEANQATSGTPTGSVTFRAQTPTNIAWVRPDSVAFMWIAVGY